jgi:hypothetical protein
VIARSAKNKHEMEGLLPCKQNMALVACATLSLLHGLAQKPNISPYNVTTEALCGV